MNILDLLVKFHYELHNYKYLPNRLLSPLRYISRNLANFCLPQYLNRSCQESQIDSGVIVSFTSYPARISEVWQVVECMMRQTYRPHKILLWLSREQFPNETDIPKNLIKRQNNIFKIRLVDGDLRSHKKYLYVSREYKDSLVLLVDDDIYYPTDMIERMLKERKRTGGVVCQYGFLMQYNSNGTIKPYTEWVKYFDHAESDSFFFGSGGGVLFCPSEIYEDLTNIDLAMQLTPRGDDIWLNAMVRLAGKQVVKIKTGSILPIDQTDNSNLYVANLSGGNDKMIAALNEYYYKIISRNVF